jgi:arsenite methyltransferase
MRRSLILLWFVIPALLVAQEHPGAKSKAEIEKMHQDPKAYISMLENPQRDAEQKPDEVLKALALKPGEAIADIGAGSGYFAFKLARQVGDSGHVYAVDINSDMILFMNRKIRGMKLKNVSTILSAPDDPFILDGSVNRFFICNTWHHVQNRVNYLGLIRKALKPGGQIVVLDYKKEQLPVGPPPEMKMAREEGLKEMEVGGFKLEKEYTFLPYQYFLVFTSK